MTRALMIAAYKYNDSRFLSESEIRIYRNKLRRLKIVRRQRLLLGTLIFIIVFSVMFMAQTFTSDAFSKNSGIEYKYYKNLSVKSGDTLTSIADDFFSRDHYDTFEDYIKEICNINGLTDENSIKAGENLVLPYYDTIYK